MVLGGLGFILFLDQMMLSIMITILGVYLGAGIHYNITPKIFVGVEGKYLWTDTVKLEYEEFGAPLEVKFKMDGIIATAVIGFRF